MQFWCFSTVPYVSDWIFHLQILRSENIEFVVAPYEADAQLAYLSTLKAEEGGIAAVISEDSDLLAYSCPAVRTCNKFWSRQMCLKHLEYSSWTLLALV